MKSYVVIGMGRFGMATARRLAELGAEVLALDTNEELIQQISHEVTNAVVGDATDPEVLRTLGVRNYDCAVVAVGSNLTASVLTTLNLKELGLPKVICKARDEPHRKVLEKVGADRVLIPEQELAWKLAQSLSSDNVMEYIDLSQDYGIVEFTVPKGWQGKTLKNMNLRARAGVNVIALRSPEGIRVSPGPDDTIEADTTVVALGKYTDLDMVQRL